MGDHMTPEQVFVKAERVQVPAWGSAGWNFAVHGRLVNGAGTVKWECRHNHRGREVALACSEKQRARWIREGRAWKPPEELGAWLDKIEKHLAKIDRDLDRILLARRLLEKSA